MTRRMLVLLLAVVLCLPMAGAAQGTRVNPAAPVEGDTITSLDAKGNEVATITLTGIERDWTGYSSSHKQPEGVEYVATALEVTVTNKDDLEISHSAFSLQVDPGVLVDQAAVRSDTIDPPMLINKETIAPGDTLAFSLVFAMPDGTPLTSLFWTTEDAFLTVASFADKP